MSKGAETAVDQWHGYVLSLSEFCQKLRAAESNRSVYQTTLSQLSIFVPHERRTSFLRSVLFPTSFISHFF